MDAPATPTADSPGLDDSMTFELLDGSSVIQNRKRRRSSLRRVSFAERPSIHIFARDDDYETPPEGTMSHLSAQSTPTSVSRSPQRRSERLSAAKGRRQGENDVDKENVPTSSGSNARLKKRGRRPLALRDTQKEKAEEFLKPSNWLDDQENSAFGSCDDNTGPVDLRFITSGGRQSVSADDDDNMTMDSQTFQTRMSQMPLKQQLQRLSEGRETATVTYTDMDVTVVWPGTQAQEGEEKLLDQPTWHKGDGNLSDMSQGSFDGLSIVRILANKKSSQKESSIHDTDGNTTEGGDNWTQDDADSQRRMASMQIRRPAFLPGADDTVSMETSPLVSNGDRRKLFINEGEQVADTRNVHDAGVSNGSQMQEGRTSKETELHAGRPLMISNNRTSICDCDDDVSMETTSQSRTGGIDLTAEMNSGTDERLFNRNLHSSTTVRGSESMELECAALESRLHRAAEPNVVHVDDAIKFISFSQADTGASEDSPVPLRHDERNFKRVSTSVAEKNSSVPMQARLDANSLSLVPSRQAQSMPVEPVAGQRVYPYNQGLERRESSLQQRIVSNDLRSSISSHAFGGFVNQSINQETSLPAANEDTVSMDITRAWNERGPRNTSVARKSSDSADSFLWGNKDQRMDMSDVDMTERYEEGITEAMPKLTSVLGGYNCDSPSVEPLKRIFQRNSNIDAEDSPVYGLTADDIQKESSSKQDDDVALHRAVDENETVSNRGLEGDTEDLQSNIGKNKNKFQNPEDTFSFKGHQKSKKEISIPKPMGQDVMPRPAFPSVKEKVEIIEANLKNHSAPQGSGQDLQDEDATADYTGQHNWRAEVSSDMSASPLSPRRPNHFQRLVKNSQTVPEQIDMGSTDSPSFRDEITAAIPNVQDLLAADGETPESGLGWNPRKIVWSAPKSKLQPLGNEVVTRQPGIDAMEDESTHSMADKLCTPTAPEQKRNMFDCMSEEADRTLNQVSHSKEVRNSVASKLLLRMMSFQDNGCAQPESSSDAESQQILRRTLHFQPESDGQLQSQSPRGDVDQQTITRDADGTMEVESVKLADEETDLNEARVDLLQREARRQKLLLEIQVAEERILSQEGLYENLREGAQDCHQVMEKRSRKDTRFEMKEMAAFCSQAQFNELERRCKLLNCMQTEWNLKTKKIGDDQVLHEFKYWSLFTHRILMRKENKAAFIVCKSMIDFNEESINQVFRHINASLAWRWLLSGQDEILQHQDLRDHVQGVHSKVMILLDLMEEVNYCRKYLVIPRFRLLTGSGLRLELQFSDSKLLFDFVLSFDMRQVTLTWYSRRPEQKIRQADINQKLDCTVEIECAGRFLGKKITEAVIRRSVASVVPGHQLFPRVCASVNTLILSMKD